MRILLLPLALLILAGPLGAAQLYRWVDDKGNVEWRDTPPPPTAKKVEQRKVGGGTIPPSELPYSLQQPVKDHPVTVWMTDCGETCTRARAHLNRRGIPHAERNPQAEVEAFKKASGGGMEMPLLLVGSRQLKGYVEGEWDAAFDAAGYPRTAVAGFKPPAKPAAQPPASKEAAAPGPVVRLYTNAQCGVQCKEAKYLLDSRGVKFQEVNADDLSAVEELKKVAVVNPQLPVLVVGRFVVPGFDSTSYHAALDESGYKRGAQ